MKKLFLLAFAAGLFAACNNNSATNEDSTAVPTEAPAMDETAPLPDTSMTTDSLNLSNPSAPNPAPTPGTDSATGPR